MGTIKYLIRVAWSTWRTEGLRNLIRETVRYLSSNGSPHKLIPHWYKRIRGQNWVVKDVQGSKMWLNYQYDGLYAGLIINGIREEKATECLQSILQPEWVVVDIGANIGYYALMEARKCKKVYAIDPALDNYQALNANIALNDYHNITVHRLAIGDRDGAAQFSLSDFSEWHRVALGDSGNTTVQMTTLDSFLKGERVDFVRMDVEGYELHILRGMEKTIEQSTPVLFIETHKKMIEEYGGSLRQLYELLASYNYILSYSTILGKFGPIGHMRDLVEDKRLYEGQSSWLFLGRSE